MRSTDLARDRAVRVLVAEVAEPPGRLSALIERAGHRVVARAAAADELAHLVQLARPEVAVFDAELSAETVAAFRASEPAVGVVVVWPEGATAELADEQVSPARIQQDLAGAVRRAAPVPAAAAAGPASLPAASSGPTSGGTSWLGRGGLELAVAATLTFLLVVTAVAFRVARGEGITFAGAPTTTASPSAPVPGTNEPVVPPEPPSGPAADTATVVGGARRNSPRAAAGDTASSALVGREPGSAEPGSADPRSTEPGPVSSIPGGAVAARPAVNGPTIFAREQACRQATAQLGIVGPGASLRRLLHRCVVTESAGLLRALARLVGTGGPGRPAAHRGGPGDAPGRGAAHQRRDGSGHHETSSGHGHSSNGHGSEHRPTGSGSGHGHGNGPGNGHGHGNGPGHGHGNGPGHGHGNGPGHGHGNGNGPGHGRVGSHVPER